ncbi:hypothetical protein B566_EDAN013203, partial [Ephemera danica]
CGGCPQRDRTSLVHTSTAAAAAASKSLGTSWSPPLSLLAPSKQIALFLHFVESILLNNEETPQGLFEDHGLG